jgi:hypothetical protein
MFSWQPLQHCFVCFFGENEGSIPARAVSLFSHGPIPIPGEWNNKCCEDAPSITQQASSQHTEHWSRTSFRQQFVDKD